MASDFVGNHENWEREQSGRLKMVDVRALSAVGASGGQVAASAVSGAGISAQAMAVLTEITQEAGLSETQVTALAAAVAQIDSGVETASVRESLFAQVSGLGVFLRKSGDDGLPRWSVMTALRAYGLNLVEKAAAEPVVVQNVRQRLENIARAAAVPVATPAPKVAVKADVPAKVAEVHKVDKVV